MNRKENNMEEIKNTKEVEEHGEGYEHDEGIEPTPEEIAEAEGEK